LPERVFKSVVRRSRKHVIRCPELLQITESLKLMSVNDSNTQRMHLNVAMYWIIEYLSHTRHILLVLLLLLLHSYNNHNKNNNWVREKTFGLYQIEVHRLSADNRYRSISSSLPIIGISHLTIGIGR